MYIVKKKQFSTKEEEYSTSGELYGRAVGGAIGAGIGGGLVLTDKGKQFIIKNLPDAATLIDTGAKLVHPGKIFKFAKEFPIIEKQLNNFVENGKGPRVLKKAIIKAMEHAPSGESLVNFIKKVPGSGKILSKLPKGIEIVDKILPKGGVARTVAKGALALTPAVAFASEGNTLGKLYDNIKNDITKKKRSSKNLVPIENPEVLSTSRGYGRALVKGGIGGLVGRNKGEQHARQRLMDGSDDYINIIQQATDKGRRRGALVGGVSGGLLGSLVSIPAALAAKKYNIIKPAWTKNIILGSTAIGTVGGATRGSVGGSSGSNKAARELVNQAKEYKRLRNTDSSDSVSGSK